MPASAVAREHEASAKAVAHPPQASILPVAQSTKRHSVTVQRVSFSIRASGIRHAPADRFPTVMDEVMIRMVDPLGMGARKRTLKFCDTPDERHVSRSERAMRGSDDTLPVRVVEMSASVELARAPANSAPDQAKQRGQVAIIRARTCRAGWPYTLRAYSR